MPDDSSQLIVEIGGDRLTDDDLRSLSEVHAEEASGVADAATLVAALEAGDSGDWASVIDAALAPSTPIVVQIARGGTTYRFEGCSTEASWSIDPVGGSRLTVTAVDRTLELDIEEKVVPWPGMADGTIAESIISGHGFEPQVESTPEGPDPDVHVVLQRGSDLAFLRSLAAKWGYSFFLEADTSRVTGHFRPIDPLADPQGELSLGFGTDAQHVTASARLVEGQRVKVARIPALSDSPQSADATGEDQSQGRTSLGGQATVLLTPADVAGELDPTSTAEALARSSAFAAQLSVEIAADRTGMLVRARQPILVKGLGSSLSGCWLVDRVRHTVTLERHRQQLTLVRNAIGLKGDEPFGGAGGAGGLGGLL